MQVFLLQDDSLMMQLDIDVYASPLPQRLSGAIYTTTRFWKPQEKDS